MGIEGAGLAGQDIVPGTTSCTASVSGSCVGSVVVTVSEAGDDGGGEGLGIIFSCLRNFLFLKVTLPVPSTFTPY